MKEVYKVRNIYRYGRGLLKLLFEEILNRFKIQIHGVRYMIGSKVCIFVSNDAKLDLGTKTWISENCTFSSSDGGNLSIGFNNYFGKNCNIISLEEIKIGDNNLFGPNVIIVDHDHYYTDNNVLICKQGYIKKKISIGSNIWIGGNVTICKGVTIVDRVIVGANSLVNRDLKEPGVYGGVPARKIKDINN